jgi:hypothetical protein
MNNILIFFSFLTSLVFAEIQSSIQNEIKVVVNDSILEFSQAWYDSLIIESSQNNLCYQISGYQTSKVSTTAKLKVPQTLKLSQIIRQVIIYYNMLQNENERRKEKLLLYPFFSDLSKPEFIKCYYSDNTYYFVVQKWEKIPSPSQPTPEERYIYNEILKNALQNTLEFGELSEDVFEEVSINQEKSIDEIHKIYEKVVLWNACR